MHLPGRPARGRAECPGLGGQRLDRNGAGDRAERRLCGRYLLILFVAQRKDEDPVVEVEIPTGRCHTAPEATVDHWMKSGAAHLGEVATSRLTWRAVCVR